MSTTNKKAVFIPLEISSRELDYKTLLASIIARQDIYCLIGQHNLLNKLLKVVKGGVYFGKNIFPERFPCSMTYYKLMKDQKFSLAFYHEEGGVLAGDEDDWDIELKRQVDPEYLSVDDAILCWGTYQESFYKSCVSNNNPSIHNVGCPRFNLENGSEMSELLEHTSRVKESGYILFNTNFAAMNHHIDNLTWFKNTLRKDNDLKYTKNTIAVYGQTMQVLGNFLEMISTVISTFPEQKFYLRPHPSEDLNFYKSIFSNFNNIEIVRDYTAIEWIQGCELLIQNGCTTSLEAHFMDKKIISYYPLPNKSNVNITKGIGISTQKTSEVIEIIKNLDDYSTQSTNLEAISQLISNFSSSQSSFEKICTIIHNMLDIKEAGTLNLLKLKIHTLIHTTSIKIKELRKYLSSQKRRDITYFTSNFPGFDYKQLQEKIRLIEKIINKELELTFVNKDLFIITQKINKKNK